MAEELGNSPTSLPAPSEGALLSTAAPADLPSPAADAEVVKVTDGFSLPPSGKPLDWRGAVDASLRYHPSLSDIKDINGLAKSYVNAQTLIGKEKIAIPDANAPEDAWNEFYTKLGRPESPDKYSFKHKPYENTAVDGDVLGQADHAWVRNIAHKLGMNDKQANGLYEELHGRYQNIINETRGKFDDTKRQWREQLRQEWRGTDYDVNIQAAQIGVRAVGGDELAEVLESSGLGDNPVLIKAFANLGKMLKEDRSIGSLAERGGFVASAAEARAEIGRLNGDKEFQTAYMQKDAPGHREAVERMERLFKAAFPKEAQ